MGAITLYITPGDPKGIGPEVTARALRVFKREHPRAKIVIVGGRSAWLKKLNPIFAPTGSPGFQSGWSIERAVALLRAHQKSGGRGALVTGPISKARLRAGGYPFDGHTDFLAHLCQKKSATMMLANSQLRVSLATIHVPLARVPALLTRTAILRAIEHTLASLKNDFGLRSPRIAVLGLNPHAGEGGQLGTEEKRVVIPALAAARKKFKLSPSRLAGPFPADTFFAVKMKQFDAVIALYHDQGLIPVKLLDFAESVNVTLGLPIIRTSVDHGTGFDLVGTGKADPSSMLAALRLAYRMARKKEIA